LQVNGRLTVSIAYLEIAGNVLRDGGHGNSQAAIYLPLKGDGFRNDFYFKG
jgi:hypothetical protein